MSVSWLHVVWTLLQAGRARAAARRLSAHKTQARQHSSSSTLTVLAFFGALMLCLICALVFAHGAPLVQEVAAEKQNQLLVESEQIQQLSSFETRSTGSRVGLIGETESWKNELEIVLLDIARDQYFAARADKRSARRYSDLDASLAAVKKHFETHGSGGFVERKALFDLPAACSLLMLMISIWWLSLVFQSDGMELDTTRRRHPMWEYFLSLPIPQSAVFTAEALTPVISNPFYWAAPLVIAGVAGIASHSLVVGICALPLGVPLVLAAAICAKTNEVLIMLRMAPRKRGASFALLSGFGMLLLLLPLLVAQSPKVSFSVLQQIYPALEHVPSARWLVQADTPLHWLRALASNLVLASGLSLVGIFTMRWAAAKGLESGFGAPDALRSTSAFARVNSKQWWRDPLLRKELLWLGRDRGALIQIFLVPALLVAVQFFNFSNVLRHFEMNWHRAAGVVMFLGAYMLFVAGPRALVSEAPALGLILSWPRPLEDTLRMKVRVLFAVMSVMVCAALFGLMFVFPSDWGKLLCVVLLWPLFGLSVVEKAVTLIQSPSSSGEPEPLPRETVWAAGLGNLSFAFGLFMGNWQIALLGLALNWVLAGALWQAFRARLPFMFDPQSQPAVRPPTILSSVLAVLGMQEFGVICSIPFLLMLGEGGLPFATTAGYGLAGALVCLLVWNYHQKHSVNLRDIIYLSDAKWRTLPSMGLAFAIGLVLSSMAICYTQFLHSEWLRLWLPSFSAELAQSEQALEASPNILIAYGLLAIFIAPWVEEFLFRGLMFRAMREQWGHWSALLLSTTFFTLLHPVASWPMVFLVGASSAWLFVRTQALAPCVLLHFVYNTVVVVTRVMG